MALRSDLLFGADGCIEGFEVFVDLGYFGLDRAPEVFVDVEG